MRAVMLPLIALLHSTAPLWRGWLVLAGAMLAASLSGCCGTGLYSLRYEDLPPGQQMPPKASCSSGVSVCEAIAAWCGPPELMHEELMYADPNAMIGPTPKYHPLPTQPVFQPSYYPPSMAMGPNGEVLPEPVVPPPTDAVTQRTARWRGPVGRLETVHSPATEVRVAKSPLADVTFPTLSPAQLVPERLAPYEPQPLRR